MSIGQHLDNIEAMAAAGRVKGTARTLVNLEAITEALNEARNALPDYMKESEAVLRQKEAIIKQAELEARRIRTYADEEATTIRQLAEEQSNASLSSAREQSRKMIDQAEVIKASEEEADEVVQKAEKRAAAIIAKGESRANSIIAASEMEADERRQGADNYAREVLFGLEERIADTLGQVRTGIDTLSTPSTKSSVTSSIN